MVEEEVEEEEEEVEEEEGKGGTLKTKLEGTQEEIFTSSDEEGSSFPLVTLTPDIVDVVEDVKMELNGKMDGSSD